MILDYQEDDVMRKLSEAWLSQCLLYEFDDMCRAERGEFLRAIRAAERIIITRAARRSGDCATSIREL
jgi:hypothetical protein